MEEEGTGDPGEGDEVEGDPDTKMEIVHLEMSEEDREAKSKALKLLESDRLGLLQLRPFIGSLCMNLRLVAVVDSRCVTASTDGHSVFFNAHWACNMPSDERMAVLAHEVWHCGLLHFVRQQGRMEEHTLWNYAVDHEVNTLLDEDGFNMPPGSVLYVQHRRKSAEQIYDMLLSGELKPRGEVIDQHLSKDPSDQDEAMVEGDGGDSSGPGGGHGTLWERSEGKVRVKVDSQYRPFRTDKPFKEWAKKMASAVQQARGRGTNLGKYGWAIDILEPRVEWREILRQFTTPLFGGSRKWLPPSRRHVHSGLYLQSRRDSLLKLVVAIDTSGSTTGEAVNAFVSELFGIAETFGNYEITIIQCDTEIGHVSTISHERPYDPSSGFELYGGGGTDLRPPFEYIKDEGIDMGSTALLYMTDGGGVAPASAPPYPVLWVLPDVGWSRPPTHWGQVIEIKG